MKQSNENRTKYSLYNALSAMLLTFINGSFGIIVTRLIIARYGSDYNGLNSTANQIIHVLLLMEGGFTLASNVALFAPLSKGDYITSNSILNATKQIFKKIGVAFLFVGVVIAAIYSLLVKTALPQEFVFTLILMAVAPQAVNFFYTTTYRILLQSQQKEFVISIFTALTIGAGHIVNIFLILHDGEMWMIRFVTMCFAILNCFLITNYTKRKNDFLNDLVKEDYTLVKGTKDVMAQKITGAIYSSWPMIFLSISQTGGTVLASVYAVYNSVYMILKALLHAVIDAPRLGFGEMLTQRKREEVWPSFREYEFIATFFIFVAMLTAFVLILPFIDLYTHGIADTNYYDKQIALLMTLISVFEMLHIPSGHLINMSGNFKVSKSFQYIACIVLIISMFVLGSIYGVYGMLLTLLIVAMLLALLEVIYVHCYFFSNKLREFLSVILAFFFCGTIIAPIEKGIFCKINNIIDFILNGFVIVVLNVVLAFTIGWFFNRTDTKKFFARLQLIWEKINYCEK